LLLSLPTAIETVRIPSSAPGNSGFHWSSGDDSHDHRQQAVISGTFSVTQQAIQLGFIAPRD
jgi:hypothetical protein